jgi:hypothetical protein
MMENSLRGTEFTHMVENTARLLTLNSKVCAAKAAILPLLRQRIDGYELIYF